MPGFNSAGNGDLTSGLFLTETDILDDLVGDSLFLWGYNAFGRLGNLSTTDVLTPIQTVSGGTNWKQFCSGRNHVSAIKTDGTLWSWGKNYGTGQLGDGTSTVDISSPVQTIAGGNNWKQVACGSNHTAAIKTDGTLWIWGSNYAGSLGDGTLFGAKSSPIQTVTGGNNWKQVDCGEYYTAAIKTDGTLWLWGYNAYGQIGDNTGGAGTNRSAPVQTIAGGTNWKQVSVGNRQTAAIKTDGTLWVWGKNNNGQLGEGSNNPTLADRSSPVQTIAGGTNWKQVSSGLSNNIAAIKTDGTLWVWGSNNFGQLGDNTTASKSSPVQTIAGGNNWKQVASGEGHTAAIKTDGTLWIWGIGGSGGLGDGTSVNKSSPVQTTAGGNNWKQVDGGMWYTAAITTGQVT